MSVSDTLYIESLDLEGRGVARRDGKVVFVDGGLPGETVQAQSLRSRKSHELAKLAHVIQASPQRVTKTCPHFGVCGGCAMQHLQPQAQVAVKQRVLEDALARAQRTLPLNHIESNSVIANITLLNHSDVIGSASHRSAKVLARLGVLRILPLQLDGSGSVSLYWRHDALYPQSVQVALDCMREVAVNPD